MACSCCLNLGGNLDFLDFLQKSFMTSTTAHDILEIRKGMQICIEPFLAVSETFLL